MAFSGKRATMETETNVAGDRFDVLENFPAKVHVVMQYIKEIASQHTYDDIYAMLEECNMDPDEATNKLLSVDTFHQVKPKHGKRRSNTSNRAWHAERSMQQRGAGGGRGNNSSASISNDAGRRRQMSVRPENGGQNHALRINDVSVPIHHRTQDPAAPHTKSVSNGSFSREPSRGASVADVRHIGKRPALLTLAVQRLTSSNPGPTPAPTPTTTSNVSSGAGFEGRNSESQSNNLPTFVNAALVSGVYSSASDPVLLPSLNPRNPGAVGTIKRETGSATEFSEHFSENRSSTDQDGRSNGQEGALSVNKTSQGVEKSNISDPSRDSRSLNHDKSSTATSKQDDVSLQQVNGPSKVMEAQAGIGMQGVNMQSLSKLNDSVATSQLDMKLERLKLSNHQPVIFPDYIQVPEDLKNGLTFGSLNDVSASSKNVKDSTRVDGTVLTDPDAALEPPLRHQTTASPLEMNALSAAAPKSDQLKPGILPQIGGSQYPFLPTPDYGFGLVPPILGPPVMPIEATEVGDSTVSSASSSSQPVGAGQNSLAVPPQMLPFLRQPYPSNYVPYPYYPPLYVPPGSHQFLHNGFPQPASTGNIYMPPAAAPGVKYPISSLYKPGTIAGNVAHFGIPPGYGCPSAIGYGLGANMTPSSSSSNEDLATPELKEKNMYSTMKQSDEQHVWSSASARDMSALPGNFFYNIPQGQQVAFSPAHSSPGHIAGMYHLTQATGGPSSVQSLPQQSQAMAGSAESGIPPSGSCQQQSHPQIHWNTRLLNRENI